MKINKEKQIFSRLIKLYNINHDCIKQCFDKYCKSNQPIYNFFVSSEFQHLISYNPNIKLNNSELDVIFNFLLKNSHLQHYHKFLNAQNATKWVDNFIFTYIWH